MSVILSVFGILTLAAALYLALRMYTAQQALNGARRSVEKLGDEMNDAMHLRQERYSTELPGREDFNDERSASQKTLAQLELTLASLESRPLLNRFSTTWRQSCRILAATASSQVHG